MGYEVILNDRYVVGTLGPDNKVTYDETKLNQAIKEIYAGNPGNAGFVASYRVIYRWDRNRKLNNDMIFRAWKTNPIIQNRIIQLNALVFGRGIKYVYDASTQKIVDRFWRINRIRQRLNAIGTDSQLYGEVFIGLYPQASGDVLMSTYESNQVEIDFDPTNVDHIIKYAVSYRNEETGKEEIFYMEPIQNYLNKIEFEHAVTPSVTKRIRKALGLNGTAKLEPGCRGVMLHVKFNNSTSEVHGTSDFKQVYDICDDYMNFVGDRLTIHQIYGSPAYDITIDTDSPEVIQQRIEELNGFSIGSNPVHNKQEEWKPLEFKNGALEPDKDERILRGLLCAGTSFPEYLLFNQSENNGDNDNSFATTKLAEDRQDAFAEALTDMHKFAVAIAGGDPLDVDDGQMVFPEVSTMSEKTKAETYVLKVGAQICSRRTASMAMGHNWELESEQILEERDMDLDGSRLDSDMAGRLGGYKSTRVNNQDQERDDGSDDRRARAQARNITTQTYGDRKENN